MVTYGNWCYLRNSIQGKRQYTQGEKCKEESERPAVPAIYNFNVQSGRFFKGGSNVWKHLDHVRKNHWSCCKQKKDTTFSECSSLSLGRSVGCPLCSPWDVNPALCSFSKHGESAIKAYVLVRAAVLFLRDIVGYSWKPSSVQNGWNQLRPPEMVWSSSPFDCAFLTAMIQTTCICSTLLEPTTNLSIFYKLFINQVPVQSVAKNPVSSSLEKEHGPRGRYRAPGSWAQAKGRWKTLQLDPGRLNLWISAGWKPGNGAHPLHGLTYRSARFILY